MYIEPNSKIYICANVPLDERFDNTYLFDSKSDQIYYINNYFIASFDKYSYQRIGRGYLKVEASADDLYGANYMTFQNTAYGNKWFFAFIKSVDYINDNVTKINYEIDPVQTWMFDWQLGQCFVEREHSETDLVGDNLVPENLGFGEIMYADEVDLFDLKPAINPEFTECVVVAAPFNKTGASAMGSVAGNMYSGLHYNIFSSYSDGTGVHSIEEQLNDFFYQVRVAVKESQIVTMFYFVKEFAVQEDSDDQPIRSHKEYTKTFAKDFSGFKNNYNDTNEPVYIPRNHKLYTAPYNYFTLTDWTGNSQDYMYEYFSNSSCGFILSGSCTCEPCIAFIPINYMGKSYNYGLTQLGNGNLDYTFWFKEFPKIPWNTDGFVAWLAQTGVALAGKVAGDWVTMGGLSAISGNMETLKYNDSVTAGNKMLAKDEWLHPSTPFKYDEYKPYQNVPTPSLNANIGRCFASGALALLHGRRVGGSMTPAPNWSIENIRVSAVRKKIRKDWAERIDSYFDMFGYATNKVKVPNISSRPSWNYVKTIGCEIHGNIPADDIRKLKDIFDNGIRFWHQNKIIGDYTQVNTPT